MKFYQYAIFFPIFEFAYCDYAIREVANVRKKLPMYGGSCECREEVANIRRQL